MGAFARYRLQDEMGHRAVKGAILLALVLALIPLAGFIWSAVPAATSLGQDNAYGLMVSQQDQLPGALEFSQQWGGSALADGVTTSESVTSLLPACYREEIPLLSEADEVRIAEEGRLVGFTMSGSSSVVYEKCVARMESAGWTCMPSGNQGQASFVKSSGTYRWAYVACYQVGDASSVVVIADSEEQEIS